MTVSDETLLAYLDGELEPAASAEVKRALDTDPELAARAAQHRRLRTRVESAYAPELGEPVPERLLAVLRAPPSGQVSRIAEARSARHAKPARHGARAPGLRLASMAAGVLLAVGAGWLVWRNSPSLMIRATDGTLLARGALARGLSDALAGDSPSSSSKVGIGLSFVAKSGDYCRTFSIARGTAGSGLACRHDGEWRIGVLEQPQRAEHSEESQYRTAGSSMPPAVLAAVQAQIAGDPLDRAAEIAARQHGWRADP